MNESSLIAYSLILDINRPVYIIVTALNVVDNATTAVIVASSKKKLDKDIYYKI